MTRHLTLTFTTEHQKKQEPPISLVGGSAAYFFR